MWAADCWRPNRRKRCHNLLGPEPPEKSRSPGKSQSWLKHSQLHQLISSDNITVERNYCPSHIITKPPALPSTFSHSTNTKTLVTPRNLHDTIHTFNNDTHVGTGDVCGKEPTLNSQFDLGGMTSLLVCCIDLQTWTSAVLFV